jgi:Na+-exporting ATPase
MGLAHRFIPSANVQNMSRDDVEQDAIFLGLVGIFDPPRLESFGAVRACREAGIVVHMFVPAGEIVLIVGLRIVFSSRLTGDHAATAKAIAQEVGILASDYPPSAVVTVSLKICDSSSTDL